MKVAISICLEPGDKPTSRLIVDHGGHAYVLDAEHGAIVLPAQRLIVLDPVKGESKTELLTLGGTACELDPESAPGS